MAASIGKVVDVVSESAAWAGRKVDGPARDGLETYLECETEEVLPPQIEAMNTIAESVGTSRSGDDCCCCCCCCSSDCCDSIGSCFSSLTDCC
jgi:hypothetical protein